MSSTRQEKRLGKLQILVTDSELANIDDWRFAQRAENRSAAVRELVSLGLALFESHPDECQAMLGKIRGE